ncbi:SufE family protein [uncultured Eubacterium sp.]|uniref:SufE family protein n=1 Tax=uncultured Eubacterium sp. TaxID=165185 RepID=UPI00259A2FEB|nr:SufE family protein [uncultured Eubacterium sp.]
MGTIAEKQAELIELYNGLDDPIMQYEFLLQLAGEVPVPEAAEKTEAAKIHNCQTDSWFIMTQADGRFSLSVDSDALLIRGVLSIFVYLLDGRSLDEILNTPIDFMEKTTVREQLSISRFSVLSKLPDTIYQFCKIQKSHK